MLFTLVVIAFDSNAVSAHKKACTYAFDGATEGLATVRNDCNIIIGGEINLTDLVGMFSDSTWTQLLAAAVTIKTATLSAGFYAVFGMYILVMLWTVLANMLIKTPIQVEKKHRRKKPLPRVSAVFRR